AGTRSRRGELQQTCGGSRTDLAAAATSRDLRELALQPEDVDARKAGVKQLLELQALAPDQLARAEPDDAVGVDRDLDQHEDVAGGRRREIDHGVAAEVAVLRGVGGLALPDVELDAKLIVLAGAEHPMLARRHDRALRDHLLAV